MSKILFYNCFAGISGDMNLGAMIDLGVDVKWLENELKKLSLKGYSLNVRREKRKGIEGTKVDVVLDSEQKPGSLLVQKPRHEHRSFRDIRLLIKQSSLPDKVKSISHEIFNRIAVAEGKIHGVPVEKVHFHEVGAIDSIVDIVGAAICIDYLKVDRIVATAPELGGGMVHCEHGIFPVPAPATVEILTGIPVTTGAVNFETTTPTGAAILAACVNEFISHFYGRITKTGYGIGHRDGEIPNVLRVMLAESADQPDTEQGMVIECNIDDMNPEMYEYVMAGLFDLGADDVFITPIIMKKSRPASTLSVITHQARSAEIIRFMLHETTTLGVRQYPVVKTMLNRETSLIQTPWGEVRIKKALFKGEIVKVKPEYEDCLCIAMVHKIPLKEVYRQVEQLINREV